LLVSVGDGVKQREIGRHGPELAATIAKLVIEVPDGCRSALSHLPHTHLAAKLRALRSPSQPIQLRYDCKKTAMVIDDKSIKYHSRQLVKLSTEIK
jgi:hypothetical protein